MPIVDAGISLNKSKAGDDWYEIGRDMNVFIKLTKNPTKKDGNLIAVVWPGYTSFVDFLNDKSYDYWKRGLDTLYSLAQFDGIWLDINEPSNNYNVYKQNLHFIKRQFRKTQPVRYNVDWRHRCLVHTNQAVSKLSDDNEYDGSTVRRCRHLRILS